MGKRQKGAAPRRGAELTGRASPGAVASGTAGRRIHSRLMNLFLFIFRPVNQVELFLFTFNDANGAGSAVAPTVAP